MTASSNQSEPPLSTNSDMTSPTTDEVSSQYRRWVYPEPIEDLPVWLKTNWQWFDPSHSHLMFWPDREKSSDLDILIAGCGTNQAAVFAHTNPQARVVGIDVSQSSLNHQSYLKHKYGLENLELLLLPIEEVGALNRDFDLIVSTGVLHHMSDPFAGMRALARCLRPDGVMAIMLYAHYGRIGVEILQSIFREMGLRQDESSIDVVKNTLAVLPPDHPLHSYLAIAPDLRFDAGLVDTFLHGRDRSYTVDACLDLVASAGLVFVDWFLKAPYYPPLASANLLHSLVSELPLERQWSIMERINTRNACHFFTACRPDRSADSYRIDFAMPKFLDYKPSLRHRCKITQTGISQSSWSMPLDRTQISLLRLMDGSRTIGQILSQASSEGAFAKMDQESREQYGGLLFQSLWQLDFVAFGLNPEASQA